MSDIQKAIGSFVSDVTPLTLSGTTIAESYFPAIQRLLVSTLKFLGLQADVRKCATARRPDGEMGLMDITIYDSVGDSILVYGTLTPPGIDLVEITMSRERNDQIGQILGQFRTVLLCNVRSIRVLTVDNNFKEEGPVPPAFRRLGKAVEFWSSLTEAGRSDQDTIEGAEALTELVGQAVTCYVQIDGIETLGRVLGRQARLAKNSLPRKLSPAIRGYRRDFGAVLGPEDEGDVEAEAFRFSIVLSVYCALFASWVLWLQRVKATAFGWRDLSTWLQFPNLRKLFKAVCHLHLSRELSLAPHLDRAAETLSRVRIETFKEPAIWGIPSALSDADQALVTAILYFQEPFLETFDAEGLESLNSL